jgi:hypothetical protein
MSMLQRFVDAAAVAAEIERAQSLSGDALRRHWQSEFGRPRCKLPLRQDKSRKGG